MAPIKCANCGTEIIRDCLSCGAPNCCPKCCAELAEYARKMDLVRLGGRLEAFAMALSECASLKQRDTEEVHRAIDILHLDTLRQIAQLEADESVDGPSAAQCNDILGKPGHYK